MSKRTHSIGLCTTFFAFLFCIRAHGSAPKPAFSPEAHTDLICHTNHASECYPAIFQPTEQFKPVHDDQSLPPGLHVRLNLATGYKEARLNVPEPDDAPKADLVIIDNPVVEPTVEEQFPFEAETSVNKEASISLESSDNLEDPLPQVPSEEANDFEYYRRNAASLFDLNPTNLESGDILKIITDLTELAHSQEWGLAVTSDTALVSILFGFIDLESGAPVEVQSAAAQLLGTAVQNNPEALDMFFEQVSKTSRSQMKVMDVVHIALEDSIETGSSPENILSQKRLLFLLSQLCHDPTETQLQQFLSESGLSTLLAIFESEPGSASDGQDQIRVKVTNFMLDHVLPVMVHWEGGSLLKEPPPGVSIKMTVRQSRWMNAIREMGPWCEALEKTLTEYEGGAENSNEEPAEAYESISEAKAMLDEALSVNGCEGGCRCNKFGRPGNEEL